MRLLSHGDKRSFDKYLSSAQPYIEFIEAHDEAARRVIRAVAEEFQKLGLKDSEFREIMRGEVEETMNSFRLPDFQKALEIGFVWSWPPVEKMLGRSGVSDSTPPVERNKRSIKNAKAAERVREFMTRQSLTQADFAVKAHIGESTLKNLLREGSASKRTWTEVAKAMSTTIEQLLKD